MEHTSGNVRFEPLGLKRLMPKTILSKPNILLTEPNILLMEPLTVPLQPLELLIDCKPFRFDLVRLTRSVVVALIIVHREQAEERCWERSAGARG